jgi:2-octaprenyl-6-methoxyphenol hydroxylase
VVVVGGGPAGLTAAIALAGAGVETVLVAKAAPPNDNRTTALLAGSVTALDLLGVWRLCRAQAAPLKIMRLIDDTARLLRAPEVAFDAAEIGMEAFGYNVENRHLVAALEAHAETLAALSRIDATVTGVESDQDGITVRLENGGSVVAKLAIAADGRNSVCRAAAGIATRSWDYPQAALVLNLEHTRPHGDTSTEFHTATGPFTLVPLPGLRSSLVWVVDREQAAALGQLGRDALAREVERRSHAILGKISVESDMTAFPLGGATAEQFAHNRTVLIGEAAHVIPPIGAQGLNLGLRDAATIAELVAEARNAGNDIADAALLARYDQSRRTDVGTRTLAVDALNRSLLTDFLPVQGLRGLGLYALSRIAPLRHAVMREGVAPRSAEPRLMRGEPL